VILEGFTSPEVGEKKGNFFSVFYIWISMCSQEYKRLIKFLYSKNPIYRQIWLHLLMDDRCIGCINKFLKNTLVLTNGQEKEQKRVLGGSLDV
jgi:hypothetical protein